MSKENPNQDYYKTGGRSQSEGPDRNLVNTTSDKHHLGQEEPVRTNDHPAVRRAKKK